MDDTNYLAHLLEEVRDQNKAILEGMKDLLKNWEFNELRRDVEAIRQGDTVMRVAVADLSQDVKVVKAAACGSL
jgi:hypothetical protein